MLAVVVSNNVHFLLLGTEKGSGGGGGGGGVSYDEACNSTSVVIIGRYPRIPILPQQSDKPGSRFARKYKAPRFHKEGSCTYMLYELIPVRDPRGLLRAIKQ